MDAENATTVTSTAEVAWQIYGAAQESMSTAFIQWHESAGGGGAQITLLQLVSRYVPRMGMPPSPWYDLSFESKGKVMCSTVTCANWLTASLLQIGTVVNVPTLQSIDSSQAAYLNLDLLGSFADGDTDAEAIGIRKTM